MNRSWLLLLTLTVAGDARAADPPRPRTLSARAVEAGTIGEDLRPALDERVPRLAGEDAPKAVIVGPAQANPGDLVVLDATSSSGVGYAWLLAGSPRTFLPVDGGRQCVFASGQAGNYVFVLSVARGDKSAITQHVVSIGVPPPGPGPAPHPIPPAPVPPPLPDGRYGLAKLAYGWASAVASGNRATEARAIAAICGAKAGEMAGVNKDPQVAINELRTEARAVCGENDAAWKTAFWIPAAAKFSEFGVASKQDAIQAFGELAAGLEVVR